MNNVDISKGYIDIPVGGDIDLKSEINRLRKEKKCYYIGSLLSEWRYTRHS